MHRLKFPPAQDPNRLRLHAPLCRLFQEGELQWRRCKCAKYLYLLRDGKNKTISAKTCSWEKAEQQAQEIRDSWDPIKQKLRELDELQQAQELGEITITYGLERWLAAGTFSRVISVIVRRLLGHVG